MNRIVFIICLLWSLIITSCVNTDIENLGRKPQPEAKVQLKLNVNSGSFAVPITRAGIAKEDVIDPSLGIWIFVFDETNNVVLAEDVTVDANGIIELNLDSFLKDEKFKVVLLVNTPTQFENASGTTKAFSSVDLVGIVTYTDLKKKLNAVRLSGSGTFPYIGNVSNSAIPMSGELVFPDGFDETQSYKIPVKRIVAKITVETSLDATNDEFELLGASVCNAPKNGYFCAPSDLTDLSLYRPNGNYDFASINCTATDSETSPLYIYESRPAEATAPIVKAKYQGTEYYYKLMMTEDYKINAVTYPMNLYMRNVHYTFNIEKVFGKGYDTFADACSGPRSNTIVASVAATDISSYDLIDNGEYYLGLSNSECHVYRSAGPYSVHIANVYVPGLERANIQGNTGYIESVDVGGMTLTATTDNDFVFFEKHNPAYLDLLITFRSAPGISTREVAVTFGNLKKVITIKTYSSIAPPTPIITYKQPEFVYGNVEPGNDWIALTEEVISPFSPSPEISSNNGEGVVLNFNSIAPSADRTASRIGELYLSRNTGAGRLKVIVHHTY